MQDYTQTSLVGDCSGVMFSDICFRDVDGSFMLNDPNKHTLDTDYPIREISVSSDCIVDGIEITYSLANSVGAITISHGCRCAEADKVNLNAHESLIAVYGRAGFQTKYERKLINSIGFVIFDSEHATARIVGPFGNSDGSCDGEAFYVSDVIAFGGFAENDKPRLSGLFFLKQGSTE